MIFYFGTYFCVYPVIVWRNVFCSSKFFSSHVCFMKHACQESIKVLKEMSELEDSFAATFLICYLCKPVLPPPPQRNQGDMNIEIKWVSLQKQLTWPLFTLISILVIKICIIFHFLLSILTVTSKSLVWSPFLATLKDSLVLLSLPESIFSPLVHN